MPDSHITRVLGIDGTRLTLDGKPFFWQGLTFFNALFNDAFNRSNDDRLGWLRTFQANGISAVRVWCEWDFPAPRRFIDVAAGRSLFTPLGDIREEYWRKLVALIEAADSLGMVVEVCMFANESEPHFLPIPSAERATQSFTEQLRPYGNILLQIWNEHSYEMARYLKIIRETDAQRLVSSDPGFVVEHGKPFDHTGSEAHNKALDILTPHTMRGEAVPFWYLAPAQMAWLIDTYKRPVIDDEPARNGPTQFGGVRGGTTPEQHITHCQRTRAAGGYHTYHHDMFQYGYGHELTPPNGIPDPDFSPFHRQVFDYLRDHPTW
jgi:hypothetical protein